MPGGAAAPLFDYPVSEEFPEMNPDTGKAHTVQYIERARFEYHPVCAGTPCMVLFGRLGAQLHAERYRNRWVTVMFSSYPTAAFSVLSGLSQASRYLTVRLRHRSRY